MEHTYKTVTKLTKAQLTRITILIEHGVRAPPRLATLHLAPLPHVAPSARRRRGPADSAADGLGGSGEDVDPTTEPRVAAQHHLQLMKVRRDGDSALLWRVRGGGTEDSSKWGRGCRYRGVV